MVEDLERPKRISLRAKARPLGTANVMLELRRSGRAGTRVTMIEAPADPVSALAFFHP